MLPAISVPEASFLQICNAASQLDCTDRDRFFADVAAVLRGQPIGPGAVARAVAEAFLAYWQPPPDAVTKPPTPPRLRKSIR